MVGGLGGSEWDAAWQPGLDGVGVCDSAGVKLGAFDVHGEVTGRANGMRGDGVGIRDVCEMFSRSEHDGKSARCDDGGGSCGKREPWMVGGHGRHELHAKVKSCRDRIRVLDDPWRRYGSFDVHREVAAGDHGMRGNRVGIGHVGEVSSGARGSWEPAGGDDVGRKDRKHQPGMVSRPVGSK